MMGTNLDAELKQVGCVYDFQIADNGDILTKDFFDTAVLMSLFAERRANASEVSASEHRRGWIGNESTTGFENGSKLWLYSQAKLTRVNINAIETAVFNGLEWFVKDNVAVRIEVNASAVEDGVSIEVIIERANSEVDKRYFTIWNNTGV